MEIVKQQTKKCRYCAEIIQLEAIKCRFCNEFLTRPKKPPGSDEKDKDEPESVFFKGRPSMWALAGFIIPALLLLALAGFLLFYPVGNFLQKYPNLNLSENRIVTIEYYARLAGFGLAGLVIMLLAAKTAKLKSTRYEVTTDRIEWARGIFSRKIDNLDMFRVVDLSLKRSLLDCIAGIGTVTLFTKDKTDPEFHFEKIKKPRKLYDILKKTTLEADQKQNVIHIE